MRIGWAIALLLAAALGATGCAVLPADPARVPSTTIIDGADTPIGRALAPQLTANPGLTGVVALADGRDAFAARVLLARAAARSIDVQVYIWHGDPTGRAMFAEMRRAADRGVRVRLLIDDNNTAGLDPLLAMLDAHPNIELRLFNPFAQRGATRLLGYATDFSRLNRRMHNKSFTVDAQVTVVGGRNIGDEYFEAGQDTTFADLDLIAAGDAVREVSASFDRYWNAASAYPAAALLSGVEPMPRETFDGLLAQDRAVPEVAEYGRALERSALVRELLAGGLHWEWVRARLVADAPEKVVEPIGTLEVAMLPRLGAAMGTPARSLDLVSPYFVPGAHGADALAALARGGVRVRVLTNSLAATDVAPVHAGYAKRRETLLAGGVELLELRPSPGAGDAGGRTPSRPGASSASLHAKTFAIDGERVFVGSFNLDPRSAALNTEMGLVVDSPALARRLSAALDAMHPALAWRVERAPEGGGVRWRDAGPAPIATEPGVGALRRAAVRALSWLPIEWLL
jgi:putative cardiolipin synthase